MKFTVWKVSKHGVFPVPYFPVFRLNTGKYGPEKLRIWTIFTHYSLTLEHINYWNVISERLSALQFQFPLGKMCSEGKDFHQKKFSLGTIFVGENSRQKKVTGKIRHFSPDEFLSIRYIMFDFPPRFLGRLKRQTINFYF